MAKRRPNFTADEVEVLLSGVDKYGKGKVCCLEPVKNYRLTGTVIKGLCKHRIGPLVPMDR